MSNDNKNHPHQTPRILILAGFVIIVAAILLLKEGEKSTLPAENAPQTQLAQALSAGKPILAFFHSNNCESCVEMISIIDQVYPDFQDYVVLVDVNVYEPQNEGLVRDTQVRYIPTQIFYDRSGNEHKVIGVIPPDSLRETLREISSGQ